MKAVEYGFSQKQTPLFNPDHRDRSSGSDHGPFHVMICILVLFLLVRLGEVTGHLPVLATSYADDLLCMPLVLGIVLWCHRHLGKQSMTYTLPRSHSLLTLALFALYFEGLLPRLKVSAVADPMDLLMYLAGYLIFETLMNKKASPIRQGYHQGSA